MTIVRQISLAGGEISPSLFGRSDQSKYTSGLRTMRNTFIMRHGGGSNRAGTSFVGEVRDSTRTIRLIPFVFSVDQTYQLEFGHLYMRVIRNGRYLTLTGQGITGISNASPGVVTYTGSDSYSNDDELALSGIIGPIGRYLNGRNFKVANVNTGSNTFELQNLDGTMVDTTNFGAYTSAGLVSEIYTLTTPYQEEELASLQTVQSADVITIVHPSHPPAQLARTGHTSWTLSDLLFAPSIAAPASASVSGSGGSLTRWAVTSVAVDTYEESLPVYTSKVDTAPTPGAPRTIAWPAVAGAVQYNVYREINGTAGFIGVVTSGLTFIDDGFEPDTTDTPPEVRNPFDGVDNYPSTVNYIQQRLSFANTNNDPEKVFMSRTGFFKNFTTSSPLQDDDAITFTMAGRQVNSVRHLLDLGTFLVLTNGGEHTIQGDSSGVIRPGDINRKQNSYNGSAELAPIVVGGTALYLQARGTIVRDLSYNFESDGYRGTDLTIFSSHLFDGLSIVDWAYQQIPHSIVWAVRSDGILLGLTYIREQNLNGWHRHDFQDGFVENVCVIPEGLEDAVYLTVRREVNGETKRYVERLNTRYFSDIKNAIFMDSTLSYDGRNTDTDKTLTLSGGTTWGHTELITLTSNVNVFETTEVGNEFQLTSPSGDNIRFRVVTYTSATEVTGLPNKIVPLTLRDEPTSTWARAVDELTGLWHMEGKEVSIVADGFVLGSPLNPSYTSYSVVNGAISPILERPYAVIHVGLPYVSDIETLDIDTVQSETLVNKKKIINAVWVETEKTRGLFAGQRFPEDQGVSGMYEMKIRNLEGYDAPVALLTGKAKIDLDSAWDDSGRCALRQIDPLPFSILSISPSGLIPFSQQ